MNEDDELGAHCALFWRPFKREHKACVMILNLLAGETTQNNNSALFLSLLFFKAGRRPTKSQKAKSSSSKRSRYLIYARQSEINNHNKSLFSLISHISSVTKCTKH